MGFPRLGSLVAIFVIVLPDAVAVDAQKVQQTGAPPNLKLLECFEFKKNFWIVGHAFHTSSVQDDAHVINSLHRRVVDLILEKDRDMDAPTREGVIAMMVDTINDIQEALIQPAVRIRADPNIQNPAVDEVAKIVRLREGRRRSTCEPIKKHTFKGWLPLSKALSNKFKDECLRACLTSAVRGSRCLSAMHVPNDDECVISDQDQFTRPELFIENDSKTSFTVNFFRNRCAHPPDSIGAGRLEARLLGYRGGQGLLELAQVRGRNPRVLVIITGLRENAKYDIVYSPKLRDATRCRSDLSGDVQVLLTVETDNTGMAVQPWKEIDWHILDDNLLSKVLLVVEKDTSSVVDCGQLLVAGGNLTEWYAASSSAVPVLLSAFILFIISLMLLA